MGSIIGLNNETFADVFIAFDTSFQRGFTQAQTQYQKVAMEVGSSGRSNTYPFLGTAPKMREWIGDRHIPSMEAYAYNLVNKKFELTQEVSRDDLSDDQYGSLGLQFEMMGQSAARHKDELVFGLLNNARTELCYDGTAFFNATHPSHGGSAQSNIDSGGSGPYWYLMDLSKPVKPLILQNREEDELVSLADPKDENVFRRDAYQFGVRARRNAGFGLWQFAQASNQDLDSSNFETAVEAMMARKDDQDRPMGIRPTHIVVPTNRYGEAKRLFQNQMNASGATNEWYGEVEIIVSEELDLT